jgi:hypothetical protein
VTRVHGIAALALLLGMLANCSKEQRVCRHMDDLCGTPPAECEAIVEDLKRAGGEEALAKLDHCYADADTCAEAKGCEARVTVESAAGAVGDFFDSLTGDGEERERDR